MDNYFLPSIFFFLLHLVLVVEGNRSKPICPSSFFCKGLGRFGFPFHNTTYPDCGLCKLNCSEETKRIQLEEEGRWYEIKEILAPGTFRVRDQKLQNQLINQSCDSFENFSFPNSPSISYSIVPNLTIFKCTNSTELAPGYKDNLTSLSYTQNFTNYQSYRKCKDYNLYYRYLNDHPSNPDNPPPNCSVIQLPAILMPFMMENAAVFNLLTAEFSLELHVSDDCLECHRKGGRCLNYNQEFRCGNVEGRRNLGLILGTATIAVGIGILIVAVFCFKRKYYTLGKFIILWKGKTENYRNVETFLKKYGSLAPKRFRYSDVKMITGSFKVKLGQGGYGSVFRGKLCNGSLVAVKVLNESKGNGEDFINEVASISRTSHVNVVTLLGFCFEGCKRALIYEFMPNGSLEKFIYNGSSLQNCQLGWVKLYQIAIGIARGLEYLHRGCNTRILHLDIKPHNILLDEDFCPKISDFGLAKLCPRKESIVSMLTARGTIGYIAPEVFCRNFGGVSHKSDVYSYGMMVLEMVGGRKNIEVGVDHTSEIYFPHWKYKKLESDEELGLHGIVNEGENEMARKMTIVGLWCIQTDPSIRPSMTRVVEMLQGSLESLQIPPKPFLSSPSRLPTDCSTVEIS